MSREKEPLLDYIKGLPESFYQRVLAYKRDFYSVGGCRAGKIPWLMLWLLRVLSNYYECPFVFTSAQICHSIVSIATVLYFKEWMAHDTNIGLSLSEYTRQTYPNPLYTNKKGDDYHAAQHAKAHRKQNFVDELKEEIREQAIRENRIKPIANKENMAEQKKRRGYATKVHSFDLWRIHQEMQGSLDILKLLNRKRFLGTTSEKKRNDSLCFAYREYYQLFQKLNPTKVSSMGNEEYVVHALMLQELEYTNRFHLAAMVALYTKQFGFSPDYQQYRDAIDALWLRIEEEDNPPVILPVDHVIPYTSYDILSYSEEIECLFEPDSDRQLRLLTPHVAKTLILRNMLLLSQAIMNPRYLANWTPDDLKYARFFLETQYPVHSIYLEACGECKDPISRFGAVNSKEQDTCYDYIRKFMAIIISAKSNSHNTFDA